MPHLVENSNVYISSYVMSKREKIRRQNMNNIEAIILDWAGTAVDYGCFAPVQAFVEVFKHFGIEPTMEEVRKPMGMLKRDHIRTMLAMPRIQKLWVEKYQGPSQESDVEKLYELFESKLLSILDEFAQPKPYVLETVEQLREKGIKIGSTTGYTDIMMDIVTQKAKEAGYEPDAWFSPDAVGSMGRPYPFMIFKNMETLKISSVQSVIKVGDTVSDIKEGKNAGVYTVGILEGSSEMALTQEEYEALSKEEKQAELDRVSKIYKEAGADCVIKDIRGILELI